MRQGRLTAKDTTTAPDAADGSCHAVGTVSGHGRLYDFQGLTQGRDLEEVQASADCRHLLARCDQSGRADRRRTQQVAELDRLLLELGRSGNANLGGSGSSGAHASKDGSGRQGRTEAGVCFFATVLKKSTAKGRVEGGRNRRVFGT